MKAFLRFPTDSNGEESLTYLSYQTLTVILTFVSNFFLCSLSQGLDKIKKVKNIF